MRPAKLLQYIAGAGIALIPLLGQILQWPLVDTVILTAYMTVLALIAAVIVGNFRPRED